MAKRARERRATRANRGRIWCIASMLSGNSYPIRDCTQHGLGAESLSTVLHMSRNVTRAAGLQTAQGKGARRPAPASCAQAADRKVQQQQRAAVQRLRTAGAEEEPTFAQARSCKRVPPRKRPHPARVGCRSAVGDAQARAIGSDSCSWERLVQLGGGRGALNRCYIRGHGRHIVANRVTSGSEPLPKTREIQYPLKERPLCRPYPATR